MGKPAARLGDIGSEHIPFPPTPIVSGSSNVHTNSRPAARLGDSLMPHAAPSSPLHGRSIAAGASTVFINSKPAARVGDSINCGGKVSTGSGNVFIGDSPSINRPRVPKLSNIVFPGQRGSQAQHQTPDSERPMLDTSDNVKIEEPTPEQIAPEVPELGPATIRLAINPANNIYGSDQFILSSTDGSISITKSVADDANPGDNYLDLKFDDLDTSKNYKLEQIDSSTGETYTYFESFSYGAIDVQSPEAVDTDDSDDD